MLAYSCFCSRSAHSHSPRVVTGSRGRERVLPFWPLGRWQVSWCRRIWNVKVNSQASADRGYSVFNLHWHRYGVRQLGIVANNPIRTRIIRSSKMHREIFGWHGRGGVYMCMSMRKQQACKFMYNRKHFRLSGSLHVQFLCNVLFCSGWLVKCWSADKPSVHVKSRQNVDAAKDKTQLSTVSQPGVCVIPWPRTSR